MTSKIINDAYNNLLGRIDHVLELNEQTWQGGMKLRLLQNQQFLDWYQQPRYWMMYKPTRAGQRQVEAVKIEVSNNSFLQFSETAKKMLPCELQFHQSIKIQTFKEFEQLQKASKALTAEISEFEKQLHDEVLKANLKKKMHLVEIEYYGQLFDWKQAKCTQRIIILARGQQYLELNYFIYHQQAAVLKADFKTPITLTTPSQRLQFMKQIIKINHVKRRNKAILQKIQTSFKKSINESFINAFKQHKLEQQRKKNELYNNNRLKDAFKTYEEKQTQAFAEILKKAVKNAKTNLFVEIFSIWISKSNIPLSVKLIVDGNQEKVYEYKHFEEKYLVYNIAQQNEEKYFRINIDGARMFRKINFIVQMKLKNSELVRYSGSHPVYVLQKRDNPFVQELVLQNSEVNFDLSSTNDTYCVIYFNQVFSRSQKMKSIVEYFQTSVFRNVGRITSKYASYYDLDYNPHSYKIIRTLLNNQSFPTKLSKFTFQRTYYQLLRFSQKEENQSQRSILLASSKANNKFLMKDRYETYSKKLLQGIGYYSKEQDFEGFFKKNYPEYVKNILQQNKVMLNKNQHKNFIEDLKLHNPRNITFIRNEIVKFIYFSTKVSKMQAFPYPLRYSSHMIPIFDTLFEMYLSSKQNDVGSNSFVRMQSYSNYLFVFIAFFARLYPYSDYANLKSDLYILRWLVQKKLPNFNDYLNRSNIGLENFITQHLLGLFTGLASELTYRIWDFLISNDQKDQPRIIVAFTLLTYMETTDLLPMIPINEFMAKVQENMKKISVEKEFAAKFSKIADTYFESEQTKQARLLKHIKGSGDNSITQDRILKKIILGQSKLKIPYEQEGKIPLTKAKQLEKQNNLTIKQLSYPLPEPNYNGHTIIEVILFLHDLHILENINLNLNKYWIKIYIPNSEWKEYVQIMHKSYFYNKSIKIPSQFINFFRASESRDKKGQIERHIRFDIVTNVDFSNKDISRQKVQLKGFIDYSLFEKDKAYKTIVCFTPQNLHNKGKTILNVSLCLKSHIYSSSLPPKKDLTSLEILCEKILDYDIDSSNQCIMACSKLSTYLQRVKFPLDQFSSDQYKRIFHKSLNEYEAQWLVSSTTSIEELKAIFYNLFNQERDKSIRHQFSKFYEIFAQEHNMQFVYFSQMLVRFVLLSNISRKKKLMYLFCILVHYQNCYSKRVTSENVNSLIKLIYKQNSLINACPYLQSTCGKVIQAYYFQSDLKSELKKDFTDIVKDWAYICNFKCGYSDIILGSARDLSILRSFFDVKTLKKMEQQRQCRFEIVYEVQGFRYIWSAVVDTKTFEVIKRGTKFLNQFTGYSNIQYLDSTQQLLLNCENTIPLQVHKSYSYEQFTKVMLSNHSVRYLLDWQSSLDLSSKKEEELVSLGQDYKEPQEEKGQPEVNSPIFNSWAIIRGQNCLESWHKCQTVKTGKVMSKVRFEFDQGHQYSIASLDLIAMQEIDLQLQKK